MSNLKLAVEIADVVAGAKGPLDVQQAAAELQSSFPEAVVTRDEIADVLASESQAAGVEIAPQ